MNKMHLLQSRSEKLKEAGSGIRKKIADIIDENSFVELSAYSFSRSEYYGADAEGEGVVTGYATVEGFPFYVVAQNYAVMNGGVSLAACEKTCKTLDVAEKNGTPVLYILHSDGVRVDEGVQVLEGMAKLLMRATALKGSVPQFVIADGNVYGQLALLCGIADFNFFMPDAAVAATSPLVIAAKSNKNLPAKDVAGAHALDRTNLATFTVSSVAEVREKVVAVSELLATRQTDGEDGNQTIAELNQAVTTENLMQVFDQGTAVEVGAGYSPAAKCVLGRIGGYSVAAVIFDGSELVELTATMVKKVRDFAEFASCYDLPYVVFANNGGIKADTCVNNSLVFKQIAEYLSIFDTLENGRISVVSKAAIGLGYTLFAAKSAGFDMTIAFANAKVALFGAEAGAEIELSGANNGTEDLVEKYSEENSDPFNAAKGGYVDTIIEPQFVKPYVVAALQMLVR